VDRLKVARRLSEQRPDNLPPLNICLQVNISGEASKSGVKLNELSSLIPEILELPNIRLRGLMAIPAPADTIEAQRVPFRALSDALNNLNKEHNLQLDTLSMGMTADLEAAISEGATLVRIGTALFGARSATRN
jgi:pyridoxal phosphate enzyme (YggS family)